ncbi:MAG: hypothetical protein IJP34_03035 [Clostridia bacterium]|nr:hypothetical protein [Clostridia bacterium]
MKNRIISIILATCLAFGITAGLSKSSLSVSAAKDKQYIDNSSLVPKYIPVTETKVDENGTPTWLDELIIMGANLHRVLNDDGADEGKPIQNLQTPNNNAIKLLDHLKEMGVNGLWVNPIGDRGIDSNGDVMGNGYANLGVNTIDTQLTGTDDYEKGWKIFANFVEEAHKRNIRVFIDVVSWGILADGEMYQLHKEDKKWFTYAYSSSGESVYFNWDDSEWFTDNGEIGLKEWFVQNVVNIQLATNCDGFRYDLEPDEAGPLVDGEVKKRLAAKGRNILNISEGNNDRGGFYDLEQGSLVAPDELKNRAAYDYLEELPILKYYNFVDCIKEGLHIGSENSRLNDEGGMYKYYTQCVSNHDYTEYPSDNNLLVMGYSAIYSPFIPVWYTGEETLAEKVVGKAVLYDTPLDWEADLKDPQARKFYENVKQMIRLRRTYKDLFVCFDGQFKDTNICKVEVENCEVIQPYARYSKNRAALIIPNFNLHTPDAVMKVHMPFKDTGLDHYSYYRVTDMITGEVIVKGTAEQIATFKIKVPINDQRVLLVEAGGKFEAIIESISDAIFGDDEEILEAEDNASTSKKKKVVYYKKRMKSADSIFGIILLIIIIVVAVAVVSAGVILFIIIRKRRKKQRLN